MKSPVYTFKKANYLYNIHDIYTCGIILDGWEVKSLDYHYGDINLAYCGFKSNNFVMLNSKITPDKTHLISDKIITNNEFKERKLLLTKKELSKIKEKIKIKGFTCIPLKLYRNKSGFWKVDIALVTGKTNYDKREKLKKESQQKEIKNNI